MDGDASSGVTLFLAGDVMIGRGVDQILPHPGDPRLYEDYIASARDYVALAERASGPIPQPVDPAYPWGDALEELEELAPDARVINLETSVTGRGEPWPGKSVHYRVSPDNAACLAACAPDVCALANNHVLDWGAAGLGDTIASLDAAGLGRAGAGRSADEAWAPATRPLPDGRRLIVASVAAPSSGVPSSWSARPGRPGVAVVDALSGDDADSVRARVEPVKRRGDIAIASIHWGPNWGFEVARQEREFARALIDGAGIDLVHGHSSHHVKGIEVYRGRPILYGCGDFIDDYEGISGYEAFRDDLGLMYFPTLDPDTGVLTRLRVTPTRIRRMRVERATDDDAAWLARTLNREGARFETSVVAVERGRFDLRWAPHSSTTTTR